MSVVMAHGNNNSQRASWAHAIMAALARLLQPERAKRPMAGPCPARNSVTASMARTVAFAFGISIAHSASLGWSSTWRHVYAFTSSSVRCLCSLSSPKAKAWFGTCNNKALMAPVRVAKPTTVLTSRSEGSTPCANMPVVEPAPPATSVTHSLAFAELCNKLSGTTTTIGWVHVWWSVSFSLSHFWLVIVSTWPVHPMPPLVPVSLCSGSSLHA
mmetsp:Transcript_80626/g.224020  ORF Transcript_80626/g.224020 Transcript_80626/m.224020 type:complete len:214 (-) Transcript_80626:16-657(-)